MERSIAASVVIVVMLIAALSATRVRRVLGLPRALRTPRVPRRARVAPRAHAAIAALGAPHERAALFLPGARDIDDPQTLAALFLVGAVPRRNSGAASADSLLASHPLVMLAAHGGTCRPVEPAFASSDPWGFAAAAARRVRDERPALCAAVGGFGSEALLIADAASEARVAFVCGTADLVQAPAFLIASDAALVGEEIFAAPARVATSPVSSAWLRAQDACRALALALVAVIALASALAHVPGLAGLRALVEKLALLLRGAA